MTDSSRQLSADTDAVARQQHADDGLNASPKHGCLKLGQDDDIGEVNDNFELQPRHRGKYVTRLRIDHEHETSDLCRDVTMEECLPCCACGDQEEEEERLVSCIWYLSGSELVMFTLHMSAIIFGVVKEALDMRHKDSLKALHFGQSVVETLATFLVLVVQMLHTRLGCVMVRQALSRLEYCSDAGKHTQVRSVRTWMWAALAAGFVLIGLCVGCFIAFYAYAHLGWTVLSNQACIVVSLTVYGLYWSRVRTAIYLISVDQYKVVIHEAMLLLKERCRDEDDVTGSSSSSSSSREAALRFIEAVSSTKSLRQPRHINETFANQQQQHQHC